MAGVPAIFQAMLDNAGRSLTTGVKMISKTIDCRFPESTIGEPLGRIQEQNRNTAIGSYPRFINNAYSTQIVVRSRDKASLEKAEGDIIEMLQMLEKKR